MIDKIKSKRGRKPKPFLEKKIKINITVDRELLKISESTGNKSSFFNNAAYAYVSSKGFLDMLTKTTCKISNGGSDEIIDLNL